MRERESARFVPRRSVTVAFNGHQNPTAYGVVANLSQGGACVWTDALLDVGQNLTLSLSFAREPLPVPVAGQVVWAAPPSSSGSPGRRCGLRWDHLAGPEDARLMEMIAASA